ncbi:C40 family peptidase [Robbsia sp. Bb-Pol-6]|uniref:C40 family peptidase n=1 Tax=Robbsia betulipollinis TaxID=2981849 RepID=A0ABT3ZJ32_9BURK|nr:C40 family peptidase [Robbsia betulipollinis]MCY0386372.1 C40 family peptidase [Robbsia betulipollinis]
MHLRTANHFLARFAAGMLTSVLVLAAQSATADETMVSQLPATPASSQVSAAPPATNSAASLSSQTLPAAYATSQGAPALSANLQGTSGADAPRPSFLAGVASKAGDVVVGALNLIGVRYRWGGNTPDSGLDCSGFVRYVFQDTLNFTLPRRAVEMSRVGEKVRFNDLKPGDLVFFNTVARTISHVGIYIGHDKFVHSPSTGSTIRVDEMNDRYWETRFRGARRVSLGNGSDDVNGDIAARLQQAARMSY